MTAVAEPARAPLPDDIARWLADQTLEGSRARSIPDELTGSERIEAIGIASVHHGKGETHGVLVVTNERIICQGHEEWERWECRSDAAITFLPVEDQVTSYLVEAGDGTIRVLRYFGDQSELDAPLARALQRLVAENGARGPGDEGQPNGSFARDCSKHSMP